MTRAAVGLLLLAFLAAPSALAGEPAPPAQEAGGGAPEFRSSDDPSAPASKKKKSKKKASAGPALDLGAGLGYEYNPFHLTPSALRDLRDDRAADRASGRFDDMDSPDDFVLRAGAAGGYRFGKKSGSRLDVELEPAVRLFLENFRLSYFEAQARVSQELSKSSELRLSLGYVPERFRRNSFADGIDEDGNGSISDSERRYRPLRDTYGGGRLAFRWDYGEKPANTVEIFAGAVARAYREPFEERREWVLEAGIEATFRGTETSGTRLSYRYARGWNPPHREVLLVDEDRYDLDFNGDGDIVDQDVRSVQRVNRTTNDHEALVRFFWETDPKRSVGGLLGFGLRVREYASGEPYDRDHRGRWDFRLGGRFALEFALGRGASLVLGPWGEIQLRWREGKTLDKTKVDYASGGVLGLVRVGF
ncbi:MAG: hypothetical protein L0216_13290 [Planctomycetales bacterium]|nr:hypothetical protein [Planctomycetales bacterium]